MAEFDGFDAKAVLVMWGKEIRIEELIDEDGHFGSVNIVCQFPYIADFSDHILECLEIYLILA